MKRTGDSGPQLATQQTGDSLAITSQDKRPPTGAKRDAQKPAGVQALREMARQVVVASSETVHESVHRARTLLRPRAGSPGCV